MHTRRVGDIAKRWAGADRILYVPGNHEYYGNDIKVARANSPDSALEHGVTLLDRGAITVDDVRFIGATLWTDLRLEGVVGEPWAHREVGQSLSDFTGAIRDRNATDGLFTTQESARRHAEDRAFIESELANARDSGLTPVVISHHAPHRKCIRPWFAKSRPEPRVRFGPRGAHRALPATAMGARTHARPGGRVARGHAHHCESARIQPRRGAQLRPRARARDLTENVMIDPHDVSIVERAPSRATKPDWNVEQLEIGS